MSPSNLSHPHARKLLRLALLAALTAHAYELDWKTERGFRFAELPVSTNGKTGFRAISANSAGISLSHQISEARGLTHPVYIDGTRGHRWRRRSRPLCSQFRPLQHAR